MGQTWRSMSKTRRMRSPSNPSRRGVTPLMSWRRSMVLDSGESRRQKASRRPVRAAPRVAAPWMRRRSRPAGWPSGREVSANSALPRMALRRLLKSWATPPARRPTASIFWASRSWSSRRCRSEMSRALSTMPCTVGSSSRLEPEISSRRQLSSAWRRRHWWMRVWVLWSRSLRKLAAGARSSVWRTDRSSWPCMASGSSPRTFREAGLAKLSSPLWSSTRIRSEEWRTRASKRPFRLAVAASAAK